MERVDVELSGEKFDKAVHGGLDDPPVPVLPSASLLEVFFKPKATERGRGAAVLTFLVQQTDGTIARAQITTTAALLDMLGAAARGYIDGGHL